MFNVGGKGLFPCWIIVLLHIPLISSWWLGKLPFLCRIPRNRTNVSSENQGIPSNTPRNPIFFGWIDPTGFGKICASERRKPNHGFFRGVNNQKMEVSVVNFPIQFCKWWIPTFLRRSPDPALQVSQQYLVQNAVRCFCLLKNWKRPGINGLV